MENVLKLETEEGITLTFDGENLSLTGLRFVDADYLQWCVDNSISTIAESLENAGPPDTLRLAKLARLNDLKRLRAIFGTGLKFFQISLSQLKHGPKS